MSRGLRNGASWQGRMVCEACMAKEGKGRHVKGCREKGREQWGVGLFIEDGAYTTIASAVTMLMALTLVFSASLAIWSAGRSADVQVSADATALAGANVVSSYHTAATVVDACSLSMGLAGFAMAGVGLVGTLVPGAQDLAGKTLDAGIRMLRLRNQFVSSASEGLQKLEQAIPFLVAAQGTRACDAQDAGRIDYSGTAIALPRTSASEFPAIEEDQIDVSELEGASDELEAAAEDLAEASKETARAKEAAWLADCGRKGMDMQERAGKLSGISAEDNPVFASSLTWDPNVALDRTRAYYRWRLEHDTSQGSGVEARADAAARHAFYGYAVDQFENAHVAERDGIVVSNVELLPKNTAEVRGTRLYTDTVWPSTFEPEGLTLHFDSSCPGVRGSAGAKLALSSIDAGMARECPVCHFSVGDVGKVPAASTSIDNGFEYHLREFTQALDEYVAARNYELELERQAKEEAEQAGDVFEDAIQALSGKRPRIAPPGRNGCIALVAADELEPPESLKTAFSAGKDVPRRGAISAAVLAPEQASEENNVLSRFCSGLEERVGSGGAAGLIDGVMDLWGKLLVAYGDMADGLSEIFDELTGGLESFGMGPLAEWMRGRLQGVVRGLGFEQVDLRLRKPVLTDSSNVFEHSDMAGFADAQKLLRKIPTGLSDPAALLEAVGYGVDSYVQSLEITLVEIPLPGGGSIPLTVRLRDVTGAWGKG